MGSAFLSNRQLRLSAWLLIFAGCQAANALAQTSGAASASPSVSSAGPASTPVSLAPSDAKAYVDRVMDSTSPQDTASAATDTYDPQGWARGLSVQFTRNVQTSNGNSAFLLDTRTETQGFQLDTYLEATSFGTLSLQALALGGSNVSGLSSWTIRQSGLPFDNGWRADNALGTTNLLMPELSRRSSRITLPGPQLIGASTQWRHAENINNSDRFTLGASVGEPGRFEGFPQSRFSGSGGRVSNVFAEAVHGPWAFAATAAQGNNITPESGFGVVDAMGSVKRTSPTNFYVSTAYGEKGYGAGNYGVAGYVSDADRAAGGRGFGLSGLNTSGFSAQLSAVGSKVDSVSSTGIYADANWQNGAHRHETSLFYLERGLTWIDRALAADLRGAAYRYGYNTKRWDITANVESFDSISGQSPHGWFSSGGIRYLLSTKFSTGGGFAIRDFAGKSNSGFGYLQWLNGFGTTRVQLDAAAGAATPSSQALTLEHSFFTETSLSLSTTLSAERLQADRLVSTTNASDNVIGSNLTLNERAPQHAFAIGLNGRYAVTDSLSLQGNLRARQLRNADGRGNNDFTIALNIGLDWQFTSGWSFNMSIYENRGVITDPTLVESPLTTPLVVRNRPTDRGIFLSARYSMRAGMSSAPLGGRVGGGAGRIEGSVFLDTNSNDARDGNEAGAANVVVLLDGRYSTRTDAAGNYQFADVASGAHALTVVQDDLPLPWTINSERRYLVNVSTRGTARVDIGARRIQ